MSYIPIEGASVMILKPIDFQKHVVFSKENVEKNLKSVLRFLPISRPSAPLMQFSNSMSKNMNPK